MSEPMTDTQMQETSRVGLHKEIRRLQAQLEDLHECVDCGGLHHFSAMVSSNPDPDGDPICPPCVDKLKLRKVVDAVQNAIPAIRNRMPYTASLLKESLRELDEGKK